MTGNLFIVSNDQLPQTEVESIGANITVGGMKTLMQATAPDQPLMLRTAHFKTSAPEEWTFDANQNPEVPGGQALAQKLRAGIEPVARTVSAVSQHSYYGWRFELAFDDVGIECVLNAAGEECYLTIGLDQSSLRGCYRAVTEARSQLAKASLTACCASSPSSPTSSGRELTYRQRDRAFAVLSGPLLERRIGTPHVRAPSRLW